MLSKNKKFLFIHLPKTGGNSLQERLKAYSEDAIVKINSIQDGVERFEVRNEYPGIHKHSSLSDYRMALPESLFSQLFVFSTIRNPWERMVSFYFSPHRRVKNWDRNAFIALVNSVKSLPELLSTSAPSHWSENANFILRFEHLDEDYRALCEKLKLKYAPLNIRNKSSRNHYSQYYDEELIQLVAERFAPEIQYGKYIFEADV